MLTQSLELIFFCAKALHFVLDNKYTWHMCAQLMIGYNEAQLKGGAFSLDMSI